MIDGIELAASGLDAYANVQDVIARNLANANTIGFKKNTVSFKSILTEVDGVETSNLQTNYGVDQSNGKLTYTGNNLDIAIDGDGFFTLETDKGMRYTRNGQFQLSSNGEIITATGSKLLGQSGPIIIPKGGREIVIDNKGVVRADGKDVGELIITNFTDLTRLVPTGDSMFTAPLETINENGDVKFRVAHGYLERSNVNAVMEMVDMIANMRSYEASTGVIKTFSDLMERLISSQTI
ncbi:MAG: flagellar hook protein [Candidatus Scalindua rubra]|uniref:Flagellar hook protein n=1 Tax=Candidatus Scalindua rubra TaxID=1872076 RepID=A0A1E3X4J5_9BACT|nr:MAG: flagellar hook protein [Candidatus Scalindua rubra]